MRIGVLTAIIAAVGIVSAQERPSAPIVFDVVSVRRSAPIEAGRPYTASAGTVSPGGRWSAHNAELSSMLRVAHNVAREQIIGGPAWIDTERFDITAIAPGDAQVSGEQMTSMVRQLLADRFSLKMHQERRPLQVFVLVRARADGALGPGMRPAAFDCRARNAAGDFDAGRPLPGQRPPCGLRMNVVDGVRQLRMGGQTITSLLPLTGARQNVGGLIIDRTGLDGQFDIDLDYVPHSTAIASTTAPTTGPSLMTAFQEQLGLKFERRREEMDVLVIDHVEMPKPN